MAFIVWENAFETGVAPIDEQHQHLVDLINILYDLIKQGKDQDKLQIILEELVAYTYYHFESEEIYFEEHHYILREEHANAHEGFKSQVKLMRLNYQGDDPREGIKLLSFLKEWLTEHILKVDVGAFKEINGIQ